MCRIHALNTHKETLRKLAKKGISTGLYHGAEYLLANKENILMNEVLGSFDGTRPLKNNAVFDVASLTKPVVVASLLLSFNLPLDEKVSTFEPKFSGGGKETVTLRHLAAHMAGFAPTRRFLDFCQTRRKVLEALLDMPLDYPPGSDVVYSCLGYMLLGKVIEHVGGQNLHNLFLERIAAPIGMVDSGFLPLENDMEPERIVPCGKRPHMRGKAGIVHDSNAWAMGGVAGSAGLFSTAGDLHRFASMLMAQTPLFDTGPMFAQQTPNGAVARTIGFELKRAGEMPTCGPDFPDCSIGHTGFTGTSLWLDKQSGLIAIFLSNRSAISHRDTLSRMKIFRYEFHRLAKLIVAEE